MDGAFRSSSLFRMLFAPSGDETWTCCLPRVTLRSPAAKYGWPAPRALCKREPSRLLQRSFIILFIIIYYLEVAGSPFLAFHLPLSRLLGPCYRVEHLAMLVDHAKFEAVFGG